MVCGLEPLLGLEARSLAGGSRGTISTERLWEVFLGDVMAGLTSLRLRQSQELSHCYRLCWVPLQLWQRLESADEDQFLCFDAMQSVANKEPWHCLELLPQGCVPCLLEFDTHIARQAVDVHELAAAIEGSELPEGATAEAHELLLPPFLRGKLGQVRRAPAPPPYHLEVYHLEILGFPETDLSETLLQSPPEAILAASLLLSLQRSREEQHEAGFTCIAPAEKEAEYRCAALGHGRDTSDATFPPPAVPPETAPPAEQAPEAPLRRTLLALASDCFAQLAEAVEVRHLGTVSTVWKGYLECALDGTNFWKEVGEALQMGVFGMALVLSLMLGWQTWHLRDLDVVDLREVDPEFTVVQWPYVVAATIFLMEFFICFIVILLLRLMLHFKDPSSGEVVFLLRLREVAETLAFIAFFAGVYYVYVLCRSPLIRMGGGSFFQGEQEYRDPWHILLWTFLAPHQWVMQSRLYTKASLPESAELMICTGFTMVFGLVGIQVDMSQEDAFLAPHWQVRLAFTLSTLCMVTTFVKAHRQPMEQATALTGGFYLKVKYVVWSLYPVVYALRSFGWISPWQEEVLFYTPLDVVAKSLSLIASSSGPLFTLFVSTWGHWTVSAGEHDFRVTVADPSWQVQQVVMDRSQDLGQQITGLTPGVSNFLRDVVLPEDRRKLQMVAKQVDKQLSFMAQKTPFTVILKDMTAPAECYVSRSLWGSRELAISLLVIGQEFPDEDDTRSLSVDSSISELTPPATEDRCYLSAGKVALHQQLAARSCRP
ncbi:unnamed protein product [Durusdinium trenchii]|uniref:Intimal thickness related receptor IRP domain-containing protein n=1 Tax=Durusdinium trenchii TaxID=1381693 RepID=A0ABP0QRZ5_9DINO